MPNPDYPSPVDVLRELADFARLEDGVAPLEDCYPKTAAGAIKARKTDLFPGRRVAWHGHEGRMIRIDADYLVPLDGNIFYPEKLAAVEEAVQGASASDPLVFDAAYGMAFVIDAVRVAESIQYHEEGSTQPVYTTGRRDLDAYLANKDEYLEAFGDPSDPDDEEVQAEDQRMQKALAEAERTGRGDLGKLGFQVRDGNHRVFGALLGGEPFVWLILEENQRQDLDDPSGGRSDTWKRLVRAQMAGSTRSR